MSIECYEIAARVDKGDLIFLDPIALGAQRIRVLLLSKAMNSAVIDGPWNNVDERNRLMNVLRADLERFVSGNLLRISLGGRQLATEDMKRLRDTNEVWEFKSKNKRGIRVFGRFAGQDFFVATNWQWRDKLGPYGSKEWKKEINLCLTEWQNLFPTYSAHFGDEIDAYVSNAEDAKLSY